MDRPNIMRALYKPASLKKKIDEAAKDNVDFYPSFKIKNLMFSTLAEHPCSAKVLHSYKTLIFKYIALFIITISNTILPVYATGNDYHYTNQIIVQFTDNIHNSLFSDSQKHNHQKKRLFLSNIKKLVNSKINYKRSMSNRKHVFKMGVYITLKHAKKISQKLMQHEGIQFSEPDAMRFPSFIPNDPYYSLQWNLHAEYGGINAEAAWDLIDHDNPIVIAILDTGIINHNDIKNRILAGGHDFISNADQASDNDSRDPNPNDEGDGVQANECGHNNPRTDTNNSWHGTMVTGVLAADTHNNIGIAGAIGHYPQIGVLPVRVLGKCGGYVSDIVDAMRWSAGLETPNTPLNSTPAKIINMSFSGKSECSVAEQNAIHEINTTETVIVVAAGNDGDDAYLSSPGNCNGVITVASITRQGGLPHYSNYGPTVDISAPGGNLQSNLANNLYSTSNNSDSDSDASNTYVHVAGTSFSTPMVTATIALMLNANPSLSVSQIYGTLMASVKNFPSDAYDTYTNCSKRLCGSGIVDMNAAVRRIIDNDIIDKPYPAKISLERSDSFTRNTSSNTRSVSSKKGGAINIIDLIGLLLIGILLLLYRKKT